MKVALLPVLLIAASTVPAADFVIEARSGGLNAASYKELSGPWMDSNVPVDTAKSSAPGLSERGKIGSRKVVVDTAINQTSAAIVASARFNVSVPRPGRYYVYATWPRAANGAPVQYVIRHGNSVDAVAMIQDGWGSQGRSNADTWNLIGGYDFTQSGDEYVQLEVPRNCVATDSRSLAQVFTDGIRITATPLTAEQLTGLPAQPISGLGGAATPSAPGGAAPTPPGLPSTIGAGPIQWQSSFDLAMSQAKATNQGLVFFFVTASSERVRRIEADVIDTPKVRQAIAGRYIPVKIDMNANEELTRKLQVFRAGTVLIYDNQLQGVAELTDPKTPDDITSRLR